MYPKKVYPVKKAKFQRPISSLIDGVYQYFLAYFAWFALDFSIIPDCFGSDLFLKTLLVILAVSYFEGHFLKRPRLKNFKNYIFVTRKVYCIIWYAQILGAIFFGTFWISTNRVLCATIGHIILVALFGVYRFNQNKPSGA